MTNHLQNPRHNPAPRCWKHGLLIQHSIVVIFWPKLWRMVARINLLKSNLRRKCENGSAEHRRSDERWSILKGEFIKFKIILEHEEEQCNVKTYISSHSVSISCILMRNENWAYSSSIFSRNCNISALLWTPQTPDICRYSRYIHNRYTHI